MTKTLAEQLEYATTRKLQAFHVGHWDGVNFWNSQINNLDKAMLAWRGQGKKEEESETATR